MLMSLVVAGNLTKDVIVSETKEKKIPHYLFLMYLVPTKKAQENPEFLPPKVKIKAFSSIENEIFKNAKAGDPVVITFDRGVHWWCSADTIVISGWTRQICLLKNKVTTPKPDPIKQEKAFNEIVDNIQGTNELDDFM